VKVPAGEEANGELQAVDPKGRAGWIAVELSARYQKAACGRRSFPGVYNWQQETGMVSAVTVCSLLDTAQRLAVGDIAAKER
jgi:hypothetical protein